MKVLLQQDVKGSGKAGDIVNVSDGYARNFLIPKGLAIPADAQSINAANISKRAAQHRKDMQRKRARELEMCIRDRHIRFFGRAYKPLQHLFTVYEQP